MNRKRVLSGIAVLIALSLFVTPGRAESKRPDTIVDLKEVLPSAILDIRYQGPHNFVGTPVDGYRAPKCLITREAAEALGKVQAELQEFSLSLKIYDCYRPQRAVDHFVRWAQDIGDRKTQKEFYPTVDKRHLFRDGYIAEKSSHTRGSTVDLTIVPFPAPAQEGYTPGQHLRRPVSCRPRSGSGTTPSTWGRASIVSTSSPIRETGRWGLRSARTGSSSRR